MTQQALVPQTFGLLATPPVRWLIGREPAVKDAIKTFARDEADGDLVEVAGPPEHGQLLRRRANPRHKVELPTIRLKLRKVRHHLTGEPGIEVTCSDDDREEIVRWHNQARARASLTNGEADAVVT